MLSKGRILVLSMLCCYFALNVETEKLDTSTALSSSAIKEQSSTECDALNVNAATNRSCTCLAVGTNVTLMCDADEHFGMTSLPLQASNVTTVTTLVISVLNRAKPNTEQVLDLRLLKRFTGVQQLNIRPKTAQLGYVRLLFDDDTFSHYTELRTLTVTVPLTNQSLHGIVQHSSVIESLDVNDVKNIGYENACSTTKMINDPTRHVRLRQFQTLGGFGFFATLLLTNFLPKRWRPTGPHGYYKFVSLSMCNSCKE